MRDELNKIIDERDAELASLQSEMSELVSELASVSATKEAHLQDKKSIKKSMKERIEGLEEQVESLSELVLPQTITKSDIKLSKINGKDFVGHEDFLKQQLVEAMAKSK